LADTLRLGDVKGKMNAGGRCFDMAIAIDHAGERLGVGDQRFRV
jgi:hypothetical protein